MLIAGSFMLALAAAPHGATQAPLVPPMEMEIDAFSEPIVPLQRPGQTNVSVRVPCAHTLPSFTGTTVDLRIEQLPQWATVIANPPQFVVDRCEPGEEYAVATGTLLAAFAATAPAVRPAPIVVRATASNGHTEDIEAQATVDVTAAYFGGLDISIEESIQNAAPGDVVTFRLNLHNFGNGVTRIHLAVAENARNATVELPDDILLESRQQGSDQTRGEMLVQVHAPDRRGPMPISIRVTSGHAEPPLVAGDTETITLLVHVRATRDDAPLDEKARALLPGASAGAVLACLLGVATLVRARRHG